MHGHDAIDKHVLSLEGWAKQKGLAKNHALYGLILDSKVKISVEIGVWGGQGALAMLFAHHDLTEAGVPDTYCVAIDPWEAEAACEGTHSQVNNTWNRNVPWEKVYQGFLQAVRTHKLDQWVRIHREKSLAVAGSFADGVIGLLHQDGNKSEEVTCAEVEAYAPKIADKGYWVVTDSGWTENGKRTMDKSLEMLIARGFVVTSENDDWRILQKGGKAPPTGMAAAEVQEPLPCVVVDGKLVFPAPGEAGIVVPPEPPAPAKPTTEQLLAKALERIEKLEAQFAANAVPFPVLDMEPSIEPATPEPTVASAESVPEPESPEPPKKRTKKTDATKTPDSFP